MNNTHLSDSSFGDIFTKFDTQHNYSIFCEVSALMSGSVNLVKKIELYHCGHDSMIMEPGFHLPPHPASHTHLMMPGTHQTPISCRPSDCWCARAHGASKYTLGAAIVN